MLPGVAIVVLGVTLIARIDTGTLTAHRGSPLPAAQLLPAVTDVTVLERTLSPVSGLCTVTENVIVAVSPGFRFPVQDTAEPA